MNKLMSVPPSCGCTVLKSFVRTVFDKSQVSVDSGLLLSKMKLSLLNMKFNEDYKRNLLLGKFFFLTRTIFP